MPPAAPGPNPLLRIGIAIAALVVVALAVAWLAGAFTPKGTRLPDRAGVYALDVGTRQSSATLHDSGTYRAAKGDVYQVSLVKNAPDPATGYARAAEGTRLQVGQVYCTGVSKAGKGGTCATLLPTGAAVSVESSTLHTAQDAAQFAAEVAAGVR